MTILDLIDQHIALHEYDVEVAEVQLMNGYSNSWYKDKCVSQNKADALKELRTAVVEALEKAKAKRKTDVWKVWLSDRPQIGRVCCSNYRAMLVVDREDHMVKAAFWTPELEKEHGVQNSHRALMDYLIEKHRDENGICTLVLGLRWGGFYTCGLGNGQQEQLTLYGESSDYPHTENSEKVKEAYLAGKRFELGKERSFGEMVSGVPDEMFD